MIILPSKRFHKYVLAGFTCDLSTVNGTAFITNPSQDLSRFAGHKLTLAAGGKTLVGWGLAAGTGETLDTEILTNPSFDANTTGWTPAGCTLASVAGGQTNNCLEITKVDLAYQSAYLDATAAIAGMLIKSTAYVKSGTSGNQAYLFGLSIGASIGTKAGTSSASWVQATQYRTGDATANYFELIKNTVTAGTMLFDTASMKKVLTPSATGITIVSAQGGATRNWTSNDGIDANAASFTLTVSAS